jgi:O-antigen/teichoic acid export membrane protein
MSSFVSNVAKLSTGTLIAQAIGILVAPILSRLFAPEAFGLLGLFASISGILGALACLRYELAIMLPKEDKNAANLFAGALIFSALISCFCSLILWMAGSHILNLFNAEQLRAYIWYIPLMVFLIGTFSAANYWNSRTQHFGRLAFVRIINSFANNFIRLTMGFGGYVGGGILILAAFLAQLISNLILYVKIWVSDGKFFTNHIRLKEIISLFYRYRRFPQYVVWSGILVDLSLKLPIFTIAYFFSAKELGYFVFVQTIVRVPFNLLGDSISKVFFQKAASISANVTELANWVERVFNFLTAFFMLPALVVSILGNDIFNLLFGANWSEAGLFAQILIFSILVEFTTAPLGSLFNVLEKQKEALRFNILLMALRFGALISGGLTGNILVTISVFVIADIIARCVKFAYIFRQSRFKIVKAFEIVLKAIVVVIPFIFCLILLKYVIALSALVNICVAALLVAINYFILMHKNNLMKSFFIDHYPSTQQTY